MRVDLDLDDRGSVIAYSSTLAMIASACESNSGDSCSAVRSAALGCIAEPVYVRPSLFHVGFHGEDVDPYALAQIWFRTAAAGSKKTATRP